MASNEAVIVENAVAKLYCLQYITIGISTLNEHFHLNITLNGNLKIKNLGYFSKA